MSSYGSTVRKIRQDKGFLQKEIYDGVVSKSFAIRFEKGEVMLKYDTFLTVLANLNVAQPEFHYIHDGYQTRASETVWQEFISTMNSNNPRRFIDFYQNHAQSQSDFLLVLSYFAHFMTIIDKVGLEKSGDNFPETEWLFIQKYFLEKQTWTLDEMSLFTIFYKVFPLAIQKELMKNCYKDMRLYREFPGHLKRVTDLLSDYILHCYNVGEVKEGNTWYIKLQSLPQEKEDIYAGLKRNLCASYYYYIKGELAQAQNLIDDVCLTLTLVGYEREAKMHRQNFKKIQSAYPKYR